MEGSELNKVLVINAGSSSIKYQLIEMPYEVKVSSGLIEKIGEKEAVLTLIYNGNKTVYHQELSNHKEAFHFLVEKLIENKVIYTIGDIVACGHRVAHGGEYFKKSEMITEDVVAKIKEIEYLAPLHNPINLQGYEEMKKILSHAIHVAVFDTSFHQDISSEVYTYPIPYRYYKKYGMRKYGFHGTSYRNVVRRVEEILGKEKSGRIIACHLGNGASIVAIKNGKSINTSMGLTPLGGLMMGTRCGDLDPSIVEFIAQKENITVEEVLNQLNRESGILGVSEISNDLRDVRKAANDGDEQSKLALEMYADRIASYIGSYYVQLGGLDTLVFTAGVGENDYRMRECVVDKIKEALGIELDYDKNSSTMGSEAIISTTNSMVNLVVVVADEEIVIARDCYEIFQSEV